MSRSPLTKADERRIAADERTVMAMARIYCRGHHHDHAPGQDLCPDCAEVIAYAQARTRACPRKHRGTCDTCPHPCYKPVMRARIREIMAYSGPRMLFHHPIMAIRHLAKKIKGHPEEDS